MNQNSRMPALSVFQKCLWSTCGTRIPLISCVSVHIAGELDRLRLQDAVQKVAQRHEMLRTVYKEDPQGNLVPEIMDTLVCHHRWLEVDDLSEIDQVFTGQTDGAQFRLANFIKEGISYRIDLCRLSDREFYFLLTMPSVSVDAHSLQQAAREICMAYLGQDPAGEVIQYRQFTDWQAGIAQSPEPAAEDYWNRIDPGEFNFSLVMQDRFEISERSAQMYRFTLPTEQTAQLGLLSKKLGASVRDILFTGFAILIQRYAEQEHIGIGFVNNSRHYDELLRTIGPMSRTLPVQAPMRPTQSFREVANKIKRTLQHAIGWEDYYPPAQRLFGAGFEYLQLDTMRWADDYTVFAISDLRSETDYFPVRLICYDYGDEVRFILAFDNGLFSENAIQLMSRHFLRLLQEILIRPDDAIAAYSTLDDHEFQQVTAGFNRTEQAFQNRTSILSLFEEQAALYPDREAVVFEATRMTYKQLNEKANQLANYLRGHYAIAPNDIIAVKLRRSERMIIAILAILKAGGAYLPLHPFYPAERNRHIMEEAGIKALLTDSEYMFDTAGELNGHLFILDIMLDGLEEGTSDPGPVNKASDLAYVIYTSGSSGQPKGVEITHYSLLNYVNWCKDRHSICPSDKTVLFSSIAFDLCYTSLWTSLACGCCLVILPETDFLDPQALIRLIREEGITYIKLTPSHFSMIMNDLDFHENVQAYCFRLVVLGGERIRTEDVGKFLAHRPEVEFLNHYGPTETTIGCITQPVTRWNFEAFCKRPVIGRPISNTSVYILNEGMRPVSVGETGEICISGDGLARGYLRNERLTKEKFIDHPFAAGAKLYRTGDKGRWTLDGKVEFLGRNDDQIKIRGFRIEVGEIEAVLLKHAGIKQAAVLAVQKEHELQLVAYVVPEGRIELSEVREFLGRFLPDYMIPVYYVRLPNLPLTGNGKVNKKALPHPKDEREDQKVKYVAPSDEVETQLAGIWKEVLNKEDIGILDNFFEIGGHSLRAVQMVSRIYKELNVKIDLKNIFDTPTIASLAELIRQSAKVSYQDILPVAEQEHYDLSHSQKRLWILNQISGNSIAYNRLAGYTLDGSLHVRAFDQAFDALIQRHEILRTVFISVKGEPRQKILSASDAGNSVQHYDLSMEEDPEAQTTKLAGEEAHMPFDLERGPLIRVKLLKISPEKRVCLFNIHHIICDGWTIRLLINELLVLYAAFSKGADNPLPSLKIQYKDYENWHRQQLDSGDGLLQKQYWLDKFRNMPAALALETDHPRPAVKTFNGDFAEIFIDEQSVSALNQLSLHHGASLFMSVLSVLYALLYRCTGQTDIVIGTPIAGREHEGLEDQLGFFVNTLPLRSDFHENDNFKDLLLHIKKLTLEAYDNQVYPYDKLVDDLSLHKDRSRNALFDVNFAWGNQDFAVAEELPVPQGLENIAVSSYRIHHDFSRFDLSFHCSEVNGGLNIGLIYNTDLFTARRARQMLLHFKELTASVISDPDLPIRSQRILPDAEVSFILQQGNAAASIADAGHTAPGLFQRQAGLHPGDIALVVGMEEISYGRLNRRANQLADLLGSLGVEKNSVIAILVRDPVNLHISLMGAMKANFPWCILDPGHPAGRLEKMIRAAEASILISDKEQEDLAAGLQDKCDGIAARLCYGLSGNLQQTDLDRYSPDDPAGGPSPQSIAYIKCSSISTVEIRCIRITHAALAGYLQYCNKIFFGDGGGGNMASFTSPAADGALTSLLCPLIAGKKVFDYSGKDLGQAFFEMFLNPGLDIVKISPDQIVDLDKMPYVPTEIRKIVVQGEQLAGRQIDMLRAFNPQMQIFQEHGFVAHSVSFALTEISGDNHICRVAGDQVLILDKNGELLPFGCVGEICLRASGGEGALLRTRLLGKWSPAGQLLVTGNKEGFVSIDFQEISMEEIADLIRSLTNEAACTVAMEGQAGERRRMIVYLTGDHHLPGVQQRLGEYLPAMMIPAHLIALPADWEKSGGSILPETFAGNVDFELARRGAYIPPRDGVESKLVEIWEKVLGHKNIGISDNFFDLGGHSLKAIQVVTGIYSELNCVVNIGDIFSNPCIQQLRDLMATLQKKEYQPIQPVDIQEYYDASHAQKRLWVVDQVDEAGIAYNSVKSKIFNGELDEAAFQRSFKELVWRHEILRTTFAVIDGEVKQKVNSDGANHFEMECIDLRHAVEKEQMAKSLSDEIVLKRFDLEKGPLLRAVLIRLEEKKYLFLLSIHHIISDAWSMDVLIGEISSLYDAFSAGRESPLAPLRIQYKDFTRWQDQQLKGQQGTELKVFWSDLLEGAPLLNLPTDNSRPQIKTFNGASCLFFMDKTLKDALSKKARQYDASLFMLLFASLSALFYQYTGENDVVLGTPVAGRDHEDLKDQIGLYANTLPVRIRFSHKAGFRQLMDKVKQTLIEIYAHSMYPFDRMVEDLHLPQVPGRSPLFEVMVVLQNNRADQASLPANVSMEGYSLNIASTKFDLSFYFIELDDGIGCEIRYNKDLFNKARIDQMSQELRSLLEYVLHDDLRPVDEIPLKSEALSAFLQSGSKVDKETDVEFSF
ncbi:amino acid adenylation domain-containing protein [Flavitalea sp. BT771]|uniref:amino acid adenylation domain-containing protein n=1 Tax=Flavitalea sp. BT771 TaxID=3063329 RepID=UPI0026E3416E|nr:non-ribosomal peptide synthetase [Flavitalea sp. BT771]MDO6435720.1 amino acid adenylation domain-containing protein [Flavitalea sp. BT771]MDV6224631.1 amino acid adenylation domain-containing protein [Flavitalea sp. BT771]